MNQKNIVNNAMDEITNFLLVFAETSGVLPVNEFNSLKKTKKEIKRLPISFVNDYVREYKYTVLRNIYTTKQCKRCLMAMIARGEI